MSTSTMKTLAVIAALALAAGSLADAQSRRSRILERGWRLHRFPQCGYQGPVPSGQEQRERWPIADAECSPGGPWGEYLYLAVTEPDPFDDLGPWPRIERVDLQGNSELFFAPPGGLVSRFASTHIAFAEPGWPGGDLLFWTYRPSGSRSGSTLFIHGLDSQLSTQLTISRFDERLFKGRLGSVLADGSGGFGFALFYQAKADPPPGSSLLGGIVRRDASGQETEFAPESLFPVFAYEEMRFGPGGDWGTGIYVSGLSFAPDGTPTTFPVDFTEFDWGAGPGLDGDMFARIRGEDPGIVYRIEPDGTFTRFARGLPGSIAACGGFLWIVNEEGCFAAELKRGGPRHRDGLPIRSAEGSR